MPSICWPQGEVTAWLFFFLFFCIPSCISGDFCICDRFCEFNHRDSHIPSSGMVHAVYVSIAGIHPSRAWVSASSESVRWNACMHRLGLGLYSHLKEFLENGVRTHVNSKGQIPSTGSSEDRTHDAASHRPVSPTHNRQLFWLHCSALIPWCVRGL